MAKTVRKKSTPYPVQARQFVSDRTSKTPFSAKDVYEAIEHAGQHDMKSSVGQINKALRGLWSEGKLVSFRDAEGNVMREAEHVAPGSAAVEHPQMFAIPGGRAPKRYTL